MKYPSILFPEKCIHINIGVNEFAEITIQGEGVRHDEIRNETHQTVLTPFGSVELKFSWFQLDFDFFVLDYESNEFMLAYTCKNIFGKWAHVQMVWLWSRAKDLDEVYYNRAIEALKKSNISAAPLMKSQQELCN
jgi:hypothetical protein